MITGRHLCVVSIFAAASVSIGLLLLYYLEDKAMITIILLNLLMLLLSIRYIYKIKV